jgi:PPM family protein phosphatase
MFGKLKQQTASEPESEALKLTASVQTDPGCVRTNNEDSGRYICPSDPELLARKGTLAVVADGMGGHASGEVASQLAVEVINRVYYEAKGDPHAALREAVERANREIFQAAARDENLSGMGTTCVAFAILGDQAYCAHVGDSRLYLLRDQQIYQLTEDHSAVMEMVKLGIIRREEAPHHPDKNVILRAVGTQAEVEVESWSEPMGVRAGDQFLLCSDGLTDLVQQDELQDMLTAHDPYSASTALIALAKERGGHDNITVAVIKASEAGETENQIARETREWEVMQ